MTRRCSHCGNNGHNSRTCPARAGGSGAGAGGGGGVKLFGVRLVEGGSMKKSASMGNISHYSSSSPSAQASPNPGSASNDPLREGGQPASGYASDDPNHASCSSSRSERKKGKISQDFSLGKYQRPKRGKTRCQRGGRADRGCERHSVAERSVTREDAVVAVLLSLFHRPKASRLPSGKAVLLDIMRILQESYDVSSLRSLQGKILKEIFVISMRCAHSFGIPWTEEEHRMFLLGLQRLGKGDWRGISRNFVVFRTPTQVASHAQKYFIRQSNATRRKRRSSLFDMVPDLPPDQDPAAEEQLLCSGKPEKPDDLPSLTLSLDRDDKPPQPTTDGMKDNDVPGSNLPPMIPAFYPALVPMSFPLLSLCMRQEEKVEGRHEVLKPTPVLPRDAVNVDHLVGMSNLTLGNASAAQPPVLSLNLLDSAPRPSAFHANPAVKVPDLGQSSGNIIHAL